MQPQCVTAVEETYYVYSAALGGAKLLELDTNGAKVKGYVYGGAMLLAKQEIYPVFGSSGVKWQHQNPGSGSWVETGANRAFERQEMDPLGQEVGTFDPILIVPDPNYTDVHADAPLFVDGGDPFHLSDGCGDIDGMPASCSEISDRMRSGSVANETVIRQGTQGWRTLQDRFTDYGVGVVSTSTYSLDRNREIRGEKLFLTVPQPQKSDCAKFADELVDLAERAQAAGPGAEIGTGRGMALSAKNYYSKSKGPNGENLFGIDGFKDILVNGGQGADVYKHVVGQAGAIMMGDDYLNPFTRREYTPQKGAKPARTGYELARSNIEFDRKQATDPTMDPKHRNEARAEVQDDLAGEDIGYLMVRAINAEGDYTTANLSADIFKILCDH